tara:strand:+ start:88 stop:1218 length:1131 start_codon:yes stop_codon:yes gene_type:complete
MAQQTIVTFPAVAKNSGLGTPLADAFKMVNDNFTELYDDETTGEVNSITATAPIVRDQAVGAVTISLANAGVTLAKVQNVAANSLLVRDANSSGVLTEKALATTQILIGDGTGMTAAALSGDATMTNAGVVSIGADKVITDKILNLNVTTDKIANDAVTADKLANSINSEIALNTDKITNATHEGDVTGATALTIAEDAVTYAKMQNLGTANRLLGSTSTGVIGETQVVAAMMAANSVDSDQYVDGSIDTIHIADNNITHDKLENRYTAINPIGTTSGPFNIDFNLGAIQTITLGGAHTGTFINFKIGQVIDIIITGNHALTFGATASGTPAINKVGDTAYDGSATQIIQVQCASADSTTPIFYYACNTYAVDTTP